MNAKSLFSFFILFLLFFNSRSFAERSIETIETRPGVTLNYLLQIPEGPIKGTLILFGGGAGEGHFAGSGSDISLSDNFLARTSPDFVKKGFAIALVGVPSDNLSGMSDAFRTSQDHSADIKKLVHILFEKMHKPIYLIGTSRGTLSAAYIATSVKDDNVKGLILTSTLSSVGDLSLEKVTVPVLIVHHGHDDCRTTPYEAAYSLKKSFAKTTRVDFVAVQGGSPGVGHFEQRGKHKGGGYGADPCKGLSHHGFLGVEKDVVTVIADWIEGKSIPDVVGD